MKANKIRNMDVADMQRQAGETEEQLFRLRFQMGMGQTEGLKKYRGLKKDRARLLTILNEKRAEGVAIPEPAPVKRAALKKAPVKKAAVKKSKTTAAAKKTK